MQRRKFLIGAGSFAAATAGAIGTGAFTSVTAQRDISLNIEPDSSGGAYLNVYPIDNAYAEYDNGMLDLTFEDNGSGTGINARANTLFEDVFGIKNQGTQEVDVLLPSFGDATTIGGVQNPAAASTQFLVDKTNSPVSDPQGVRLSGGSTNTVDVDSVDISWPEGIAPKNKPSDPVPQDETLSGDASHSNADRVSPTYTGLRYPGGAARLSSGEAVKVDVRFTVSNERSSQDSRDAGLLYRAVETSASDADWSK